MLSEGGSVVRAYYALLGQARDACGFLAEVVLPRSSARNR